MSQSVTRSILIFIGPPGCGKGTISSRLMRDYGFAQLSTGNLCRMHITKGTMQGHAIDFALKSGKLIPDEIITEMVEQWLSHQSDPYIGIILDGFPRTKKQAQLLSTMLKMRFNDKVIPVIVHFHISDEEVHRRVSSRLVCVKADCQAVYSQAHESLRPQNNRTCNVCGTHLMQRTDDQAILERLKIYREHEQDLLNFYQDNQKDSVIACNAEQDPEKVYQEIMRLVGLSSL